MTREDRELWALLWADPTVRAWATCAATCALAAAIGVVLGLAIAVLTMI